MIRSTFAVSALLCAAVPAQGDKLPKPPGIDAIKAKELRAHAMFLASDELKGRLTGSPGQEQAADYIAKHFEKLGLEKLGDRKGLTRVRQYKMRYRVTRFSLSGTGIHLGAGQDAKKFGSVFDRGFAVLPKRKGVIKPRGKIEIVDPDDRKKYPAEDEPVAVEGEFVYAGLVGQRKFKKGVELEDWTGKIPVFVVALPKTPKGFGIERQMGTGMFLLMGLKLRAERLAKRGAKVAVFCALDDDSSLTNMLTYCSIVAGQDFVHKDSSKSSQMVQMMRMMAASIPSVFVGEKVGHQLLGAIGIEKAAAHKPQDAAAVAKLAQPKGKIDLTVKYDPLSSATNVCALLRGSHDVRRADAIVYSAHMDHVGMRLDGEVFNGADDNASGTSGLLAIASAYASLETRPKRSIIFLAVSGEELGLWGSEHYANEPTWSRVDIVANINTDMIGRNGPESGPMEITVTPSYRHNKFSTLVQDSARIAEQMGITLRNGDKYYARSDHFNFAKVGIPVVFFCNGEHKDYHQVTDHPELLDFAKMERVARLAYWTGYLVAQSGLRPGALGRREGWLPKRDQRK